MAARYCEATGILGVGTYRSEPFLLSYISAIEPNGCYLARAAETASRNFVARSVIT